MRRLRRVLQWLFIGSAAVAAIIAVDIGPFGVWNLALLGYAFVVLNVAYILSRDKFIR